MARRGTTGFTRWQLTALLTAVAMSISGLSWAQKAPSAPGSTAPSATPAPRETPRPDQLEPGVNTSASTPSPAETRASSAGNDEQATAPSDTNAQKAAGSQGSRKGPSVPAAQTASAAAPKSGAAGKGQDRIELDTTQITGNRELPKVLYIVPWKRSDLGDLVGKPVNSLLDEVLAPVDRDVFKRENRYYEALKPDQGGAAAAGAAAPAASGEKH